MITQVTKPLGDVTYKRELIPSRPSISSRDEGEPEQVKSQKLSWYIQKRAAGPIVSCSYCLFDAFSFKIQIKVPMVCLYFDGNFTRKHFFKKMRLGLIE
ncbi:MAG: hypothetical protein KAS66_11920 [Candidatus Omnitrophica bacterium]|nr:hypothetical protein [Candidatus Omnitrophota bacterium]